MADLTLATKQIKAEFVLFDVFNVLHHADENDNTEMRKVMERLTQFQEETGASIGIVHHFNKNVDERSLTQRLRGSGAIAGWAEWLIGIALMNDSEEFKVRRMEFDIKADQSPDPVYFVIESRDTWAQLKRSENYKQTAEKQRSAASLLKQ